ncbi:hypothetical protein BDY19DRAFT_623065 [Irpex rosettiformis]|uniref:Uncharacterized protein n=1 Tax=Irpex rosettiformis TaxID=378272 RepID=A0ACB8UAX1_9APHY|nr:hypothetical protein BDY19DRAFT_623065 [Irpex rosettiformis]
MVSIFHPDDGLDQCRSSKFMVSKLIKYTINTGAIAFLMTTCILITFNVTHDNIIFLGFSEVIVKVYGNSMLAWYDFPLQPRIQVWTIIQISKDTIVVDSDTTSTSWRGRGRDDTLPRGESNSSSSEPESEDRSSVKDVDEKALDVVGIGVGVV